MNARYLRRPSLIDKATGVALTIAGPFQGFTTGLIVFAVASILKVAVNRLGVFDDGQSNRSFKS